MQITSNYRGFTVDGEPVAKGRPRVTRRGIAYTPKETVLREQAIRDAYLERYGGDDPLPKGMPLELRMMFFFQIPKSFSKKKRQAALDGEERPTKKPDLDNLIKTIDALNGIAFHDDSQIVKVKAEKFYSEHPQTTIIITECRDENKIEESKSESEKERKRETHTGYDCQGY